MGDASWFRRGAQTTRRHVRIGAGRPGILPKTRGNLGQGHLPFISWTKVVLERRFSDLIVVLASRCGDLERAQIRIPVRWGKPRSPRTSPLPRVGRFSIRVTITVHRYQELISPRGIERARADKPPSHSRWTRSPTVGRFGDGRSRGLRSCPRMTWPLGAKNDCFFDLQVKEISALNMTLAVVNGNAVEDEFDRWVVAGNCFNPRELRE